MKVMSEEPVSKGIKYLTDKYDIDFDEIASRIKEKNYDKIAIQIPDGFKMHALEISDLLHKKTGAEVYIWGGSAYGACDIPTGLEKLGIKMIIQFGHAKFRADEIKHPVEIKDDKDRN